MLSTGSRASLMLFQQWLEFEKTGVMSFPVYHHLGRIPLFAVVNHEQLVNDLTSEKEEKNRILVDSHEKVSATSTNSKPSLTPRKKLPDFVLLFLLQHKDINRILLVMVQDHRSLVTMKISTSQILSLLSLVGFLAGVVRFWRPTDLEESPPFSEVFPAWNDVVSMAHLSHLVYDFKSVADFTCANFTSFASANETKDLSKVARCQ